jgi:histidinol-phosphate aminotransferase
MALADVQNADATRYPDPHYTVLRQSLADFHGVDACRVVLAGSASEFIFRITAWVAAQGGARVLLPKHHYGDYARAAHAWGLMPSAHADEAQLLWACEPSSPLGQAQASLGRALGLSTVVLDRAYAPLRLSGCSSFSSAQLDQVWQLFTPNKALGLTGVRAAYVIAPLSAVDRVQSLVQMAPSWPVGTHGVAMLHAWVKPEVQTWLADCLPVLRDWKAHQIALLEALGWSVLPSDANYFCAQAPQPLDLAQLRQAHGIKLRDAASFGLPQWVRLGVLGLDSQAALHQALQILSVEQQGVEP